MSALPTSVLGSALEAFDEVLWTEQICRDIGIKPDRDRHELCVQDIRAAVVVSPLDEIEIYITLYERADIRELLIASLHEERTRRLASAPRMTDELAAEDLQRALRNWGDTLPGLCGAYQQAPCIM